MLQSKEIMEEFRGLLNMELPGRKLITFILCGLPEIEHNLKLDEPLHQRVAVRFALHTLGLEPTFEYISHRLSVVGSQGQVFTQQAMKDIHKFSRGYPRLINTICDNALFEAYLRQIKPITPDIIRKVSIDLGLISPSYQDQIRSLREEIARQRHRQI